MTPPFRAVHGLLRNPFEGLQKWGSETVIPVLSGSSAPNRKQMARVLVIISTGIFILAVLFSMIRGIGFFVSLGLVIAGCFSMITGGILRETTKDGSPTGQNVGLQDTDDIYA